MSRNNDFSEYAFGERFELKDCRVIILDCIFGAMGIVFGSLYLLNGDVDAKGLMLFVAIALCAVVAVWLFNLSILRKKTYLYLDVEGIHYLIQMKAGGTMSGDIEWKDVVRCEKVSGWGDFILVTMKDDETVLLELKNFFFNKKRFLAAVEHYHSMSGAKTGTYTSIVETSTRIDWKSIAIGAITVACMMIAKAVFKYFVSN